MRALSLLAGLLVLPAVAEAGDWKPFANDRYGFSVDIPAAFKASPPPDNNDGLTFTSPNGASEIRTYGHLLENGTTLIDDEKQTERFSADDHLRVTYRHASARDFTLSGLKGQGIVYGSPRK